MPLPTGTAGPDGKFALNSYTRGDGAPAGDYQVAIVWAEAVKGDYLPEAPPMRDRLNDRYSGPKRPA